MTDKSQSWKIATSILVILLAIAIYNIWRSSLPSKPEQRDEIDYYTFLEDNKYIPVITNNKFYILDEKRGAIYLVSEDHLIFIDIPNDRKALEQRKNYRETAPR